jgi:predicted PolB exonuclease-like 3'-5' exonuclease
VFQTVQPVVWAFDAEWVPCPASGRRLLGLDPEMPNADVFAAMWEAGGATAERPRPFLKLAWCRVVSIVVVERRVTPAGETLVTLCSLPRDGHASEADVLRAFVDGLARRRPQLVGFNTHASDLPILRQRALAHGIGAPGLCARPDRPWAGPDYSHPHNEWNVDLMRALGGRGAASPSLADLASLCGIPAKRLGSGSMHGGDVADLWLAGGIDDIRRYNECDALTTYLLWLRAALLAGLFTAEQHAAEEGAVERVLEHHAGRGAVHLQAFLEQWRAQDLLASRGADMVADIAVR